MDGPSPSVTPIEGLRVSPTAALFEGGELIDGSIFITRYDRDQGPELHLHPYPEAFVVQAGTATFTVGEDEHTVPAGNVVVVGADTVHCFKNRTEVPLEVVSFHPSPRVEQTDL